MRSDVIRGLRFDTDCTLLLVAMTNDHDSEFAASVHRLLFPAHSESLLPSFSSSSPSLYISSSLLASLSPPPSAYHRLLLSSPSSTSNSLPIILAKDSHFAVSASVLPALPEFSIP